MALEERKGLMEATFAAGCFWHVEDALMQVKGVVMTEVGFMGGRTPNPSYKQARAYQPPMSARIGLQVGF